MGWRSSSSIIPPLANTYSYEMMRELDEAILTARMDEAARATCVGKGGKFFSAGADIKMLASANPRFKYYFCLHANETLLRLADSRLRDRCLEWSHRRGRTGDRHGM